VFDRDSLSMEQNQVNRVNKDPRIENERWFVCLFIQRQTSFNLTNCSLFWLWTCVLSVTGRKKLDEVDDGTGFSTTTSGVEVNIGGWCWWFVRFNDEGELE